MSRWPEVSLGEICDFKYGKSLPAKHRDGGVFPVFGSNGVVGRHSLAQSDGPTIIIGRKGSFGEVNYSPDSCWPIDTTYYIDSSATSVDLKWLARLLPTLGLTEMNRAAAIPGLNREDAYRSKVLLPPLDEQRRIAAILDKADAIRTKRRQTLTQLDLCPTAIYSQTVAPDTPIIRLGDIAQVKGGKRLPKGVSYSDQRTAHAYIRVSDFRDGYISDEDMPFLDLATFEKLKRYTVEANDVVISIAGSIGITATIPKHLVGANLTENAARITPRSNAEAWHPEWVRMSLRSPGVQAQIRRATGQVTIGKLALFRIEDLQISLPSVSVQQRFAKRLNAVAELRRKIEMDLEHLDYLFASLQSRAFKGEL
ncbi:restriction endonuclease subunit S [Dermabacter vaginalis]|uniref:Type I restriction modification DNA specificity domain-containing protein n=1 Tax=Dermabacter vaginalis TaxID=1630135 RepID=A0ABX6A2W9_9MICO|nr:restriction endonuclease subunit S [Dermabacter vaginalis]QEU10989.1 hypothetical protein FOB48_00825 [Dermabacter vaginalis]